MAKLSLPVNPAFSLDVTLRESDEYTRAVFLKFEHFVTADTIRGVSEMFMTPIQLELLGKFLLRQAEEIKQAQLHREQA